MSDDLESDAEWLAVLAGFRAHFWSTRVPAFWQAWEQARDRPVAQWDNELKRSVHGLAGVAALVGHPEVGDHARAIESHWDKRDMDEDGIRRLMDDLVGELHALETAQGPAEEPQS